MKRIFCILASLITFVNPLFALADSLSIKDGRYNGGPVLIVQLTNSQTDKIKNHYKPYQEIKLTKNQQNYIKNNSQMKEPPTKLIVVHPKDTTDDCTCGLSNIGLIINESTIEVPKEFLLSDKEAKKRQVE